MFASNIGAVEERVFEGPQELGDSLEFPLPLVDTDNSSIGGET